MTKILAINASHRGERGYTQFLIDKFLKGAVNAGAECETVVLANHKINQCIGCRTCQKQEYYLKCVFDNKDDVKMIFEKMRASSIIVYATPIYIFTMSGLMKIFLDRITSTGDSSILTVSKNGLFFHHIDKELVSKPSIILTTQDNFEDETSASVFSYFKTFSRFQDAKIIGKISIKSGIASGHGKDNEKERRFPKLKAVYEAIEKSGFEVVSKGKIIAKTERIANMSIISIPALILFLLKFKFMRKNKKFMGKLLENARKSKITV